MRTKSTTMLSTVAVATLAACGDQLPIQNAGPFGRPATSPDKEAREAPTIAELAGEVAQLIEGADGTALERILSEVEALTDEEAAHQLDGTGTAGNPG